MAHTRVLRKQCVRRDPSVTARAPVPTQAAALGKYIREEHSRFVQAYADNDDLVHRAAACG